MGENNPRGRRLASWAGALVVAAGLVWAGCGGSDGPSSPSTPSPTPAANACSAISGGSFSGSAVTNGTECPLSGTSVVLVNLRDADGRTSVGRCTGTVIAPRAVLTAAHCLDGDTKVVGVFVGTGSEITASAFHVHPRYSSGGGPAFDIGVVLTSQDLGRTPIPLLFSRDAAVGETVVISGWGRDLSGAVEFLRAGWNSVSAVSPLSLETSYSGTTSSVCFGDSGGPLLVSSGGVAAIAGVTSETSLSGYNCANSTSYFAAVRPADVRSFILGLVPDAAQR